MTKLADPRPFDSKKVEIDPATNLPVLPEGQYWFITRREVHVVKMAVEGKTTRQTYSHSSYPRREINYDSFEKMSEVATEIEANPSTHTGSFLPVRSVKVVETTRRQARGTTFWRKRAIYEDVPTYKVTFIQDSTVAAYRMEDRKSITTAQEAMHLAMEHMKQTWNDNERQKLLGAYPPKSLPVIHTASKEKKAVKK